jgi:ATP-binding cassette subfamily A (ABC1) protein 3
MEADEVCSAKFYEPIEGNWESTITIRELSKSFGGFKAVDGISLNLYKSKILCLLGHNGAGKTTTLSLLTGLIQKTGGRVSVYGLDLNEDIEQIRQSTGLCS